MSRARSGALNFSSDGIGWNTVGCKWADFMVMLSSLRAAHQHSGLKTSEGAGACGFLNKLWFASFGETCDTSALRLNELEYDPARSR